MRGETLFDLSVSPQRTFMSIGLVLALLAVIGWGAGDVFSRKAMLHVSPGAVVVVIAALIVLTLGVAVVAAESLASLFLLPWHIYVLTALMGFLTHVGGQLLYLQGMHRAGITIAAPLIASVPMFSILLAVVLGGERPNAGTLFGAFIIITGVVLVLTDRNRVLKR